ncbi:MAG: hypothetical protein JWO80_1195 [Bryobacterales bacterium]|nr:hypothetical protein [Bryobacterales bacterium]
MPAIIQPDTHVAQTDPPNVVRDNIEAVANLEQEFLKSRTPVDRIIDVIADFTGSLRFVIGHLVLFGVWFLVNGISVPGISHFDPYPYTLLSTVVSCEAVILSALVLMKQNRMGRHADERDHLHLQINLLAEKEITHIIQTLQVMSKHMGIEESARDPQTRELSKDTTVDHLAAELRDKIHNIGEE